MRYDHDRKRESSYSVYPPFSDSCIHKDLASYKKEVLAGDADYNLITVLTSTDGIDLASAVHKCSLIHDELVRNFLETKDDVLQHMNGVPAWGQKIDTQIAAYVDGLGAC